VNGVVYDLGHLDPFELAVSVAAVGGKPGRPGKVAFGVTLLIHFSHHCFTTSCSTENPVVPLLAYTDERRGDTRNFCAERWSLSRCLPDLIRTLQARRCYLTGRGNFFTVEGTGMAGEYTVFFNVRTVAADRALFFVESAYERFDAPERHRGVQKIGLNAILRNTRLGRQPHRAR
jgi:hypothetical protein